MATQTDLIWNQLVWTFERIGKEFAQPPYSVTLWSTHPDLGEDTCNTGADFMTRDEAIACYRAIVMFPTTGHAERSPESTMAGHTGVWAFVMIDGPDAHEVTAQPDQRALKRYRRELAIDDAAGEREHAMQAGMAFGCDGYNDAMGY